MLKLLEYHFGDDPVDSVEIASIGAPSGAGSPAWTGGTMPAPSEIVTPLRQMP
jgi:hypothetical protein